MLSSQMCPTDHRVKGIRVSPRILDILIYFRIRHSVAHLRPVILSADWSIRRLQSWTCLSLPTVAEFVKLTQSIVIEIQRQSGVTPLGKMNRLWHYPMRTICIISGPRSTNQFSFQVIQRVYQTVNHCILMKTNKMATTGYESSERSDKSHPGK